MRFGTGDGPQTGSARGIIEGSRPGAKGVGQMRTLWEELETEGDPFVQYPDDPDQSGLSNDPPDPE